MGITVFLADDHQWVRNGLRSLLQTQHDIQVVGDAANGRDAVERVLQLCPDIVIADIAMPLMNGVEAAQKICEACPSVRVIILSMHSTAEHISRALQAGACGYLLKGSAGLELIDAIRVVYGGSRYLSPEILEKLPAQLAD